MTPEEIQEMISKSPCYVFFFVHCMVMLIWGTFSQNKKKTGQRRKIPHNHNLSFLKFLSISTPFSWFEKFVRNFPNFGSHDHILSSNSWHSLDTLPKNLSLQPPRIWLAHICLICCKCVCVCVWTERERERGWESVCNRCDSALMY